MAQLLLCHRWLQSLSDVYQRWRSDCQQNLYDTRDVRKYKAEALQSLIASENIVLLEVRRYAEVLYPIVTVLPQISHDPSKYKVIKKCANRQTR